MSEHILSCPIDPIYYADPRGLGAVLFEKMKKYRKNIAQIDAETGATQTYEEMILRSIRVAQQMKARGITSEDIITLCSNNIMDSYVTFLAVIFLGARTSCLDPSLSCRDTEHLLVQVKPKLLFAGIESVELLETALKNAKLDIDIVVFGETEKHIPFSEFTISNGMEDTFEPKLVNDIYDVAIIFFSSGTTGLPKGICATHYGLLTKLNAKNEEDFLKEVDLNSFLYFTTLYWISAVQLLIISILKGLPRVLCSKFEEETALKMIEKYKITFLFIAPFFLHSFIKYPKISEHDLSSLKCVAVGGGVIGEQQLSEFKKLLPDAIVINGYGLTETHGLALAFDFAKDYEFIQNKPTSVGKPIQGLTYKVVDTETEEILGPNKQGELRIKAKSLMKGYFNKPEESAAAWDKDGFLHTGDIVYYDEDHCFYIVDRIKEMFRFQSWHITPAELESVLLAHPEITDAAVIGFPHEVDGDRPMGIIVLKPGSTLTEDDILTYYNANVSDRKRLRAGVKFMDSLPYTPTGKLQRRILRQKFVHQK